MEFSEKLTALLSLTDIKGAELADSLGLGRPYISRIKTGERKMPSNVKTIRNIAEFFSTRFEDAFRLNALSNYTCDPRLNGSVNEGVIANVLCDWLMGVSRAQETPAGRFLSSFELFSNDTLPDERKQSDGKAPDSHGVFAYYKNDGKRQAVKDMLAYVDTLDKPCKIGLFTDESLDWLTEDVVFSRWLNASLSNQASRGITFERIQPPFNGVEFLFASIERWLPGYMAGAIQQYYYPWARDSLHRRTIFIFPGHIVLYSSSVYSIRESGMTILTRDAGIVEILTNEYAAIMKLCRPAMKTYRANTERIFTEAESVAAIEDTGIYKTGGLSINTLPAEIRERIRQLNTPFAKRLCESFEKRYESREKVLRNNQITDIMRFSKIEDIINGTVPIPGTYALQNKIIYYTPAEYKTHLEQILWFLTTFPNYNAVFTDDTNPDNVIAYAKGDTRALLVKIKEPFVVFDITEQTMAAAFCAYLRRFADERLMLGSRRDTIERVKAEIAKIASVL